MDAAKLGINLGNDGWQVCAHTHTPSGVEVNLRDREHWNWSDMRIPFDAISWLYTTGQGPDPVVSRNDLQYRWVEDVDWALRKMFHIQPETFSADDELQLFLDRVDCYCDVYLDGKRIGRAQNQFREHAFDIDELSGGEQELLLYVRSARSINNVLEAAYGQLPAGFDSGRVHSRRCQAVTGWDFTPRLSSVSVLAAPEIRTVDSIGISHPHVYASGIPAVTPGQAVAQDVQLHLTIDLNSRRRAAGELEWEITDLETSEVVATAKETLSIKPRKQSVELLLSVPEARLWWSIGLGDQPMYRATAKFRATDRLQNEYEGEQSCTFGIRSLTIERQRDEGGESFTPLLNGVPVFCRGANWLPVKILPAQVQSEDYRALIAAAMGAGMNCLRVWGGGVYEHDEFYELCNRAGILVWQDFMFASAAYPVYREFLDEVEAEAVYQVRRLRNHPCLMLWCGNSENEWLHQIGDLKKGSEHRVIGETIWSHVLREVVEDYDPSRYYHQSSPFGKNRLDYNDMASGDRHSWAVWADWEPIEFYMQDTGRFISEFGMQALPASETIGTIAPNAKDLNDADLSYHQRMPEGSERLLRYVASHFAIPDDLSKWVETTQLMQGLTLSRAVEHWRRQRAHTAGCLIWQLNDPYPCITWSLIDFYQRPKSALLAARRFFSPVLLSMELRINDIPASAVPPALWQQNSPATEPTCILAGEQQITCSPVQAVIQCQFHVVNATGLHLSGAVYVEFYAPGVEVESMPGVHVNLEPNGGQVAITHLPDDELLKQIDQLTVKARFELEEDSQKKLMALNEAVVARQHAIAGEAVGIAGGNKLIMPADLTVGLTFEGTLVEPKYYQSGSET